MKSQDFDIHRLINDGHIREIPYDFEYRFWEARLAKLYHAVKQPEPSGLIHSWLGRHADQKNAPIVALIALFWESV